MGTFGQRKPEIFDVSKGDFISEIEADDKSVTGFVGKRTHVLFLVIAGSVKYDEIARYPSVHISVWKSSNPVSS